MRRSLKLLHAELNNSGYTCSCGITMSPKTKTYVSTIYLPQAAEEESPVCPWVVVPEAQAMQLLALFSPL